MAAWNKGNGKGVNFLQRLVGHRGTDCILWPYHKQRDGYGNFGHNNKMHRAHRFMCAKDGSIGDLVIYRNGNKHNVFSVISADPIRQAIIDTCDAYIAEKSSALGALGVNCAIKLAKRCSICGRSDSTEDCERNNCGLLR